MKALLITVTLLVSLTTTACCGIIGATIEYEPIGGNAYTIEVEVFTCLSTPTDHPEIIVDFGAGPEVFPRVYIQDNPDIDLRRSIYQADHTFVGDGSYTIRATIGGRAAGIVNIPNSNSQSLCVEAMLRIDPELGPNNSIRFNTPPTEVVQNWNVFSYDPGTTELDGDSLIFELATPAGTGCLPIQGYETPVGVNYVWLDPSTGTFIWDYPPFWGEFVIAIRGSEYRNGQLIGQVTRDMTICIAGFVVGMEEGPTLDGLGIAPSLTSGPFWISNPMEVPVSIAIHSSAGTVVYRSTIASGRSNVDLGSVAAGPYIVEAIAPDGRRFVGRVMKE